MIKNKLQIFFTLILIGFIIWWISFQHVVAKYGKSVEWFEATYGLVALGGSIIGLFASRRWGGLKSTLGKALLFFSLGLLAQETGQLIYAYYVDIDKIQIPYPSWGDVAYFGSVLFYITAAVFLSKVVAIKFSIRKNMTYKIIATIVPLVLLVVSYMILLHNHHFDTTKPITVFLDNGYPIGEAVYISIGITAYLLSRKFLGGVMKSGILLVMFALLVQYISDFTFVYQSNRNTYQSGNYDDLFYLIAYYMMTLAMIRFHIIYKKLQTKSQPGTTQSKSTSSAEGES